MGSEGLSHGDKFKRGLASGMLFTGLSAGIGLTREPLASATTQSPEVSTIVPTAEQFYTGKFNFLVSLVNKIMDSNKPQKNIIVEKQPLGKPLEMNPGFFIIAGASVNIISKNKTNELEVFYNETIHRVKPKSYLSFINFSMTLYKASPSQILSKTNPILPQYYSFNLVNHNLGRNWEASKWGFNVAGDTNIPFSQKVGIALTSRSSNATLTAVQMSSVDNLVAQAEATLSAMENGDTLKAVGVVDGNTEYALFPSNK